ncbi:hypothetical protein AAL_07802 [Moelleriella libera RCEF 2490]|uniref:Thiol methyltransferase n=1 Tax=Moelleriella libera RCEF 2490 TaxID=1081109 RepID=A0A167WQR8_9HYPO|nr:hypothetical protein AAL_07802 [Moelleriella libera RCEF 2490]
MDAPISSPSGGTTTMSNTSTRQSPSIFQPTSAPAPAPAPTAAAASGHLKPSSSSSTDAFLKDFSLVAEAAKRAQVAVMVRDFENCGLS